VLCVFNEIRGRSLQLSVWTKLFRSHVCTPNLELASTQNYIQPGLSIDTHASSCAVFGRILQNIPANFRLQNAHEYRTPVTVQVIANSPQNLRSLTVQAHDVWLWLSAALDVSLKIFLKFESCDKKLQITTCLAFKPARCDLPCS
jgi:hypothetical protein